MNAKFFEEQRREMVAAIRAIAEHIAAELGKTALDERVLRAMAKVPRHEFVPVEVQSYAISYALPANVNLAFLGSNSAGDWAVGDFWGPLGNETRAWLDFLSTGRPSVHATPEQAILNLRTTYAIERAVATGQAVRLD
jgi:hypothetical protein